MMQHLVPLYQVEAVLRHVVRLVKERDPEQFRLRDDEGALPLHIAIALENHITSSYHLR